MSQSKVSLDGTTYRLISALLAGLLILTMVVIIPDAQASDSDNPPGDTTTTVAEEDPVVEDPIVEETTTTVAEEDPVVEETTTTVAEEEPVAEETTTTVAEEEPVVEETTTTVAHEEPVVEETTTTVAAETTETNTTTTSLAEPAAIEPLVALDEIEEEEEEPTYQITFVKRVCDSYDDIRANDNVPNVFVEHAEPIGSPVTWLEVTPASEEPAHPNCSPKSGWNFSFGTGIENLTPSLSQVTGNFGASIVTQASTPELDAFGAPTGGTVLGAVTYDITPEQWQAGLDSQNGLLSVSEGTIGAGSAAIPDGFGFGALRCGYDNRHGNNVEWIKMFHGNPDATHAYCYAYNVADPVPDFDITKDAVDIDGVPYVVGNVAQVGQTINYDVTVTNTGDVDFTDLVIEDPGLDAPGLTCAWPGADNELDAGDSVTCNGSHIATDADAITGVFYNQSTAESAEYGISKDDDETVPVESQEPDLAIDKVAVDIDGVPYVGGDVATVGQTINYEVTVTNIGNVGLTDVAIEDPGLDAPGLNCAWPNGVGVLAVGDGSSATLGDGDTVTCTGSHVTTTADGDLGEFVNTSTAASNEWELFVDDDETVPVEPVEVTYQITFVKRVCDSYDDIRANFTNPNLLVEHAEPIGVPVTWLEVTPESEEPAHPNCSPQTGWDFSLGTGIDPLSGPLSQVTGQFPISIVTEASTPELDAFGIPTGDTVFGAVTYDITQEQWDAGLDSPNGLLSVSEGTTSGSGAILPEGFGFGALRCGYDNRHGDNVEWLEFFHGNPEATHVYCYAYNVADTPDFEIEKDAADIDGVPYVVGDVAQVGQTINYEVTVTNTGNIDFTDLVIEDPGLDAPGLTCAWPGADNELDAGDSVTCNGSHIATEADAIAGSFYNQSTAESDEYEITKDDDETVEVDGDPVIEVVKTVDKPVIIAKDIVEFTITVTNTGNLTLNNLTLDDVMTYGVGQSEDLLGCEIPDDTTLAPDGSTQAQCSIELDNTTYGDVVLNTVTATATPTVGEDVSDSADATVVILAPSPQFLGAACISEPVEGFGFSLDQPLLEWITTDWGPTFDPATDTIELRIWTNDQDPAVDAPTTVYEVPFHSDLLGQEPYASAVGAPTSDRIFTENGDSYLFWPGYSNTGWLGPENGLAGIVYPGAEYRPTAYQFAFNPETKVVVVEYPPATPDCVPGGALTIDKLVGPLGTPAGSADFVDPYQRAVGETEVTWQITLKNITDYSLFNVYLTDDVSPSCVTAFEAVVQTNADGNFMTPQEELQFTCDLDVGDDEVTNVVAAGGIDLWGEILAEVTDFAQTQLSDVPDGAIGDTVWNDKNKNGVQDDSEPGVAGVTVRLTLPDGTMLDKTTDATGYYLFGNLAAGTYTSALLKNTLPDPGDGEWQITTAESYTIDLGADEQFLAATTEQYLDADFGIVIILPVMPDTGIESGTIFAVAMALLALGSAGVLATIRRRDEEDGSVAA